MTRSNDRPLVQPQIGDQTAARRVLKWLSHTESAPRNAAAAVDCVAHVQVDKQRNAAENPLETPFTEVTSPKAALQAATVRQRVAALWKKWKSRAVGNKTDKSVSGKSLSPAVLKRHQQHFDQQSISSIGGFGYDVSSVLAAATGGPAWVGKQGRPVLQPTYPQQGRAANQGEPPSPRAAVVQGSTVDRAYASSFYQPSSAGSGSPQTPKPSVSAAAVLPPIPRSSPVSLGALRYSTSYSSTVPPAGETSSPSVTPRGGSFARGSAASTSFARTCSNEPSQQDAPSGPSCSRELDELLAPGQEHIARPAAYTVAVDATYPAQHPAMSTPARQTQMQVMQRSPLQHSPDRLMSPQHPQLQQLLQAPNMQQPGLQQLQPAVHKSSPLVPAGSALTAYPWLQGYRGVTGIQQQGHAGQMSPSAVSASSGHPAASAHPTAGSPHKALNTSSAHSPVAVPGHVSESPFASLATQSSAVAAASGPCAPTAAAMAELEASTTPEDVQNWLMRAALLEDELQGRALEVAEELQLQQERRELFASLASAMQRSAAGSAEHEAAVQEAADSLGVKLGVGSRGALYRSRSGSSSRPTSPGIRAHVKVEITRLDHCIAKLQGRAAGLGSALATLQGCQAVLGSSKAMHLKPCSRLAVLQLVLSDVAGRLPDEKLQDLEVLEGLPSLDAEAREICALAGAGSIQASVQPLLQSGMVSAQASPAPAAVSTAHAPVPTRDAGLQTPSMYVSGLTRQGLGFYAASVSSATTHSRATAYPYSGPPPDTCSQQQAPWYADLSAPGDGDDDDDADSIMDSLSSVLSNRHHTPRPSMSYESRKAAAAAAAASRQVVAALTAQRQARGGFAPTVASGSAAAAGAAALTLAGIASSGSWSQWPPGDDSASVDHGKHGGMWDMVGVHQSWQQQPQSPSSITSSRRTASRAGIGFGPSGLPFPLPSCPESPRGPPAQPTGFSQYDQALLRGVPTALANISVSMHNIEQQLLYTQGAGTGLVQPATAAGIAGQQQVWEPTLRALHSQARPIADLSADAAIQDGTQQQGERSRGSSFESCVSARSRFSMEVASAAAAGGMPKGPNGLEQVSASGAPAQQTGVQMPAGAAVTAAPSAVSTAAMPAHELLSAALPAGMDVNSMTVGQLLQVLTAAVTQQQQPATGSHNG